jgi:anti-anti-sigma factor
MLRLAYRQAVTLDLHGELDLSRDGEIAARIGEALAGADVEELAVDLADVTFLDCHTIGVLLRGQRVAAACGVRMYVVNAIDPLVKSVLDITGVAAQLRPSTDSAGPVASASPAQRPAA